MKAPLLQTKLYIPPLRAARVARPRLIEQLSEGFRSGRKLTLVSAPAGFGKTTLISDWLHQSKWPTAWLSLDEGDNDPIRFLVYLVAALQTVQANIAGEVLAALQSAQPPAIEPALTALLNEIAAMPDRFALVLDDYHVIDTEPVGRAVAFLLTHLPLQLHLVITTREDPPLPLARLRARNRLTELRAADLRFTPTEVTEFLNQAMGLALSSEEIAALEARTEGWVAGLQMAAISMQGRTDTASFIRAFTGSHRFIIDYLAEEVLQRQPEDVRSFLVQTSILARLSGPLCDAVIENLRMGEWANSVASDASQFIDSQFILEYLERANLFVVPLDDQRQWYRYHHLFVDVLQARLMKEQPDQASGLHQRASEWYEQNDLPAEAIHHAFAAEDFERAARLVELVWPALFNGFQPKTWLGWVKGLPGELVRARPVLNLGCAWALLDGGELEDAEASLHDAERWLAATAADLNSQPPQGLPSGMIVVNEAAFRTLPASIASARAYLAQARGDVHATVKYARRALDLWPADDHYQRGIAAIFLGLAYWASGKLESAYQSIAGCVANMRLAGNIYFQVVGAAMLADIKTVQGRLHGARRSYEQSLQLATKQHGFVLQGTADLYVGLSDLAREQGDLEAATQHLLAGKKELAEQAVLPGSKARWCAAMARIKQAEDDLDGALDLLDEAERVYKRDPLPDMCPIAALRARVWVAQGKLKEALSWARERGLSADDDLSYLGEFEYVTLARILIAQYKSDGVEHAIHDAMSLLERLLQAAEAGDRMRSAIEIMVLQALAHEAQGNIAAALAPLKRALALAEPEGYAQIFVDEGRPMQTLLAESLARGADAGYVTRLLAAVNQQKGDEAATPDPNQLLIEPLSNRELDVLGLIAVGHTNQAIADELVIAVSTVKKHANNIFGKLGVGSRTQAVSRARELGLL